MGEIVLSRARNYAKLRHVSNRAVDKHPAIIVVCFFERCPAVEFARDEGLLTALRSGGHSFAGFVLMEIQRAQSHMLSLTRRDRRRALARY